MAHVKKKHLSFQNSLKDYLSLSYKVKRGLMVLFVLIFLEVIILAWLHYRPVTAPAVDFTAFKNEIDAFYAAAACCGLGRLGGTGCRVSDAELCEGGLLVKEGGLLVCEGGLFA